MHFFGFGAACKGLSKMSMQSIFPAPAIENEDIPAELLAMKSGRFLYRPELNT